MAKILLAHARMDRIPARRLAEALRDAGHLPWMVEDELCLGESFAGALARGLRDTKAVVECLSPAAVSSGWTAFEAGLVKAHAPEQVQVLQVRFEEVRPPEATAPREGIDLFPGEKGWRAGVARLLRALDGERGASTLALESLQEFIQEVREEQPSDALDLCIERLGTGELTRRLLEGASIFAPEWEIPLEWVIPTGLGLEAGGQPVSQDIRDALQSLERMGLLRLSSGGIFLQGKVRERVSMLMPAGLRELVVLRGLSRIASWLHATVQAGSSWEEVDARRPHIEEVLRLAEPSEHAMPWVVVASELGDTSSKQQLLARALSAVERVEVGDFYRMLLYRQLAEACRRYGKEAEVERLLSGERVLAARLLPGGVGAEALQRGLRLFSRGDVPHETRLEALRDALAVARQSDDPANGARALYLLADLEGRQGAWEQARDHAREGLQLALRAGVPILVAEGYRLLGDAALHGSYYEDARMNYEEAIRRYDGLGETYRASSTRWLLVTLLLQLGHQDGVASHVSWMRERLLKPDLLEEERRNLTEVLSLAERRLSPREKGGRAFGP